MSGDGSDAPSALDLRRRALSRLGTRADAASERAAAAAALGVLHELASSPSTAADALALLHELQVHQVEIDLQEDELRRSRLEMEAALARQVQLYEHAPVGFFTIDRSIAVHEVNRAGARLLGFERAFLLGESLSTFLLPAAREALEAMLQRVTAEAGATVGDLQIRSQNGRVHAVRASLQPDPAGDRFLMAIMVADAHTAGAGPSRS